MISFFKHLYQFCSTGMIELRAISNEGQVWREYISLDNLDKIISFCQKHMSKNLYYGTALRNGGGTKNHITEIPCVWCDVDFKDTPKEDLRQRVKGLPLKPTIYVRTGGGVHLYWIFNEPLAKGDIRVLEDINRRVAFQLGGDMNACDAARILRIPDTVNHKYPHKPLCEVAK